ncbi:MAG TPA: electron transfer flavoprotein subunit beta/FixA family protein, partial [Trinickia sp.]|nr:electron transfer flavoprotein subunit beta/FixA family protein [Trinickia sp.]
MTTLEKLERIAVLVSVGHHRIAGTDCYSRNDALSLEIARTLAHAHHAVLDVLHAGEASSPALTDYLALGAPRIDVIDCRDGDDPVPALAKHVQSASLVLTGTRAEGAYDSGMLPYRLAAELCRPLIDSALDVSIENGRATVTQFLPKGMRRRVDAALPCVVAVHPQASAAPRYAYARAVTGAIARDGAAACSDRDAEHWCIAAAQRKPVKLAATEKRSGHARMLMATTTESRGGNVVIDGSS